MIARLEKLFGRFAIPNITLILIVGQVAVFIAAQRDPGLLNRLELVPSKVLNGEVHRLLGFLIMPPRTILIWAFFFWYLFYLMGTALEVHWGTFRYNLFLLIGYVASVATGFITPNAVVSNWFLQGTVFLAFAYLNPDFQLLIMFILPVKIKWLALLAWVSFAFTFATGDWAQRLTVASAVLNFFVFFGHDILYRARRGQRRIKSQVLQIGSRPPDHFHKCDICGITDASHPDMDFRYCSQCSGDLCYCTDHIRDHEHKAFEQDS